MATSRRRGQVQVRTEEKVARAEVLQATVPTAPPVTVQKRDPTFSVAVVTPEKTQAVQQAQATIAQRAPTPVTAQVVTRGEERFAGSFAGGQPAQVRREEVIVVRQEPPRAPPPPTPAQQLGVTGVSSQSLASRLGFASESALQSAIDQGRVTPAQVSAVTASKPEPPKQQLTSTGLPVPVAVKQEPVTLTGSLSSVAQQFTKTEQQQLLKGTAPKPLQDKAFSSGFFLFAGQNPSFIQQAFAQEAPVTPAGTQRLQTGSVLAAPPLSVRDTINVFEPTPEPERRRTERQEFISPTGAVFTTPSEGQRIANQIVGLEREQVTPQIQIGGPSFIGGTTTEFVPSGLQQKERELVSPTRGQIKSAEQIRQETQSVRGGDPFIQSLGTLAERRVAEGQVIGRGEGFGIDGDPLQRAIIERTREEQDIARLANVIQADRFKAITGAKTGAQALGIAQASPQANPFFTFGRSVLVPEGGNVFIGERAEETAGLLQTPEGRARLAEIISTTPRPSLQETLGFRIPETFRGPPTLDVSVREPLGVSSARQQVPLIAEVRSLESPFDNFAQRLTPVRETTRTEIRDGVPTVITSRQIQRADATIFQTDLVPDRLFIPDNVQRPTRRLSSLVPNQIAQQRVPDIEVPASQVAGQQARTPINPFAPTPSQQRADPVFGAFQSLGRGFSESLQNELIGFQNLGSAISGGAIPEREFFQTPSQQILGGVVEGGRQQIFGEGQFADEAGRGLQRARETSERDPFFALGDAIAQGALIVGTLGIGKAVSVGARVAGTASKSATAISTATKTATKTGTGVSKGTQIAGGSATIFEPTKVTPRVSGLLDRSLFQTAEELGEVSRAPTRRIDPRARLSQKELRDVELRLGADELSGLPSTLRSPIPARTPVQGLSPAITDDALFRLQRGRGQLTPRTVEFDPFQNISLGAVEQVVQRGGRAVTARLGEGTGRVIRSGDDVFGGFGDDISRVTRSPLDDIGKTTGKTTKRTTTETAKRTGAEAGEVPTSRLVTVFDDVPVTTPRGVKAPTPSAGRTPEIFRAPENPLAPAGGGRGSLPARGRGTGEGALGGLFTGVTGIGGITAIGGFEEAFGEAVTPRGITSTGLGSRATARERADVRQRGQTAIRSDQIFRLDADQGSRQAQREPQIFPSPQRAPLQQDQPFRFVQRQQFDQVFENPLGRGRGRGGGFFFGGGEAEGEASGRNRRFFRVFDVARTPFGRVERGLGVQAQADVPFFEVSQVLGRAPRKSLTERFFEL